MAHRLSRALFTLFAFALVLPLFGCNLQFLHVVIPDFAASAVEGVQVWRLQEGTNQPIARGQLVFNGDPYVAPDGFEVIDYTQVAPDGTTGFTLQSPVNRNPAAPQQLELWLFYDRQDPEGWHKVSTYNAQGSSALSLAQSYL